MEQIAATMQQRSGVVLATNRVALAQARLARRMNELGLRSLTEYAAYLKGPMGNEEVDVMIDLLTTNTTAFFRESHHFELLSRDVIGPAIRKAQAGLRDRTIRIWSAGCSRGHEPYSIAGVLLRDLPNIVGWNARILATDIVSTTLNYAMEGRYPLQEASAVPTAMRKHIFRGARDGEAQVGEVARSIITFKRLNLIEEWPVSKKYDAIFCRNVLIYFDRETQEKILNKFAKRLKPEGRLFIGHSESVKGMQVPMRLVGPTAYALTE
jgi:chemotaxis protein methyltransferase CheR